MNAGKVALLGFARGGSSLIGQMVLRAFGPRARDFVADQHYQAGRVLEEIPVDDLRAAYEQHDIVGVFRDVTPEVLEASGDARAICVVRDPRDCVVSWYHARRLHPGDDLFDPDESFDRYLETGDRFHESATRILEFLSRRDALTLKYEDVFANPAEAMCRIIEFVGPPVERKYIDLAIVEAQFSQLVTDADSHQRSGLPYSAIKSLPPRLLEILNERYEPLLRALGYPMRSEDVPKVDDRSEMDALKRFVLQLAEQNHFRREDIDNLRSELSQIKEALRALSRLA